MLATVGQHSCIEPTAVHSKLLAHELAVWQLLTGSSSFSVLPLRYCGEPRLHAEFMSASYVKHFSVCTLTVSAKAFAMLASLKTFWVENLAA